MKAAEERKQKRDERFSRGRGEDYGDLLESVTVSKKSARRRFISKRNGDRVAYVHGQKKMGKIIIIIIIIYKLHFPPHRRNKSAQSCAQVEKKNTNKKKEPQPSESTL